jgi:hypothetical protein
MDRTAGRPAQVTCKMFIGLGDLAKMGSFYPADLATMLRQRWQQAGFASETLPNDGALRALLDTAYQASLLREESTPVRCRILVAASADDELNALQSPDGLHIVQFEECREFTAQQVRKVASAVGYYRSLIGVQVDAQGGTQSSVWGMIVTGTGWVSHTENTYHNAASLPPRLVIHILGPGHLVFAAGLTRVVETVSGQVLTEGFDPFLSEWLPKHFESVRTTLLGQLDDGLNTSAPVRLCDSFVRDVAQNMVRRVLGLVRNRGHGGMLIYLSDESDDRLKNWLRIRMRFRQSEATNRFQVLMLRLMQRALEIGAANGIAEVRWIDFLEMHDAALGKLNASLIEFSHFLADLMSVDGSLVLDREFRLIGFGGEILGDSHVSYIERAIDLEAEASVTEAADASGTRHRSAYRLVSGLQNTIAVVVSQDGGVRFVAHRSGRLVYWPYLP